MGKENIFMEQSLCVEIVETPSTQINTRCCVHYYYNNSITQCNIVHTLILPRNSADDKNLLSTLQHCSTATLLQILPVTFYRHHQCRLTA